MKTSGEIMVGAIDMGQGANTILANRGRVLDIPLEMVELSGMSTQQHPYDAVASNCTFMSGNAVKGSGEYAFQMKLLPGITILLIN